MCLSTGSLLIFFDRLFLHSSRLPAGTQTVTLASSVNMHAVRCSTKYTHPSRISSHLIPCCAYTVQIGAKLKLASMACALSLQAPGTSAAESALTPINSIPKSVIPSCHHISRPASACTSSLYIYLLSSITWQFSSVSV